MSMPNTTVFQAELLTDILIAAEADDDISRGLRVFEAWLVTAGVIKPRSRTFDDTAIDEIV